MDTHDPWQTKLSGELSKRIFVLYRCTLNLFSWEFKQNLFLINSGRENLILLVYRVVNILDETHCSIIGARRLQS